MQWARRSMRAAAATGLLALGLSQALWAGTKAAIARFEGVEGNAFRLRSGQRTALRFGTLIFPADEIETGAGAKLQIRLNDGSLLVQGGGTGLCLEDVALPAQGLPGRGLVVMGDGILRLILQGGGAWEDCTVKASTSVASVRGTDFVAENQAQSSAVFVVGGLVEVSGKAGGCARLSAGQGTTVPLEMSVPRAKRWGEARVAETMAQVKVTL